MRGKSSECNYKGVEIVEGAVCTDTSMCMYTTQDERIQFYGIPEREEHANDR